MMFKLLLFSSFLVFATLALQACFWSSPSGQICAWAVCIDSDSYGMRRTRL